MRILFTRFPFESADGGAENQTMWLMEGLRARGHDVAFLGSCSVLLERARELKIESGELNIGLPPVTKWSAISFLWRKKKMQERLIRAVNSLIALSSKPKALVMLSLSEKILLTEWAAKQGVKVFWVEHDSIGKWLTKNPWLPAMRRASKHATIICVSELSRKMYAEMGFDAERVVAIPNGVPARHETSDMRHETSDMRHQSSAQQGLKSHVSSLTSLKIGTIARLSPEKGIDILIQAIADLPEFTLYIIGTGPEEGYLRTLIAKDTERMGTARIHLQNRIDDLHNFFESLDAFVLPSSDHDPFGLVAAEAMARGIPTIVTDACGIAGYLMADEEALIAQANSVASLRLSLVSMLDPAVRQGLSEAGKRAVKQKLSVERMVEAYEKLTTY